MPKGTRKGQGLSGRKQSAHTTLGIELIFDVLWERGIDPLPPDIRARVARVRARRGESEDSR